MCKKIALVYFVITAKQKDTLKIAVLSYKNSKIMDITIRKVRIIVLKTFSSALTGKHDLFNLLSQFKIVSLIRMLITLLLKPQLVKITVILLVIYATLYSLL